MRPLLLLGLGFVTVLAACAGGTGTLPGSNRTAASAVNAAAAVTSKTYRITGPCAITGCTSSVTLNGVTIGSVQFTDGVAYFQNTNFIGSMTFLGRSYRDFGGKFYQSGSVIIGGLTYWKWHLTGTFSGGMDTFAAEWGVRGHSGRGGGITTIYLDGSIVTPFTTPAPTPTPSPPPTPAPTPTDN